MGALAGCEKLGNGVCETDGCFFTGDEWDRVRALSPLGDPPPDTSNQYLPLDATGHIRADAADDVVVQLGWRLYYERRLSGLATWVDMMGHEAPSFRACLGGEIGLSCASCHDPLNGGSDDTSIPRTVSIGAGWYDVNSQQTLNAAHFRFIYWNGRSDSLWSQAAQVMESRVSVNGNRSRTYRLIQDDASYNQAFAAAFPGWSPPPDELRRNTEVHVLASKAIAAYEWLLTSVDSAFDRFVAEGPRSDALSPAQKRGLKLFVGRASCVDCHNTPLFSDGKFHNIGIPQVGDTVPTVATCQNPPLAANGMIDAFYCNCRTPGGACLPLGAHSGLQKLYPVSDARDRQLAALGDFQRWGRFSDDPTGEKFAQLVGNDPAWARQNTECYQWAARGDPDGGASGSPGPDTCLEDGRLINAWRTPSLRDVALTAPYMHDGVYPTLADVVWHYDQGVGVDPNLPAPAAAPAAASSDGGADAGADAGAGGAAPGTRAGALAVELKPLHLSAQDREDLVAFLRSLSGRSRFPRIAGPPTSALPASAPGACVIPVPATDGGAGDGGIVDGAEQ